MLTLRLPPELEPRLMEVAKNTGQSKSSLAKEAMFMHLDELEDAYLALDRRRAGKNPVPWEDVKREVASYGEE
jgi:RHH-type transcriptional regulator, rel operon repressor / antitoxin RelB